MNPKGAKDRLIKALDSALKQAFPTEKDRVTDVHLVIGGPKCISDLRSHEVTLNSREVTVNTIKDIKRKCNSQALSDEKLERLHCSFYQFIVDGRMTESAPIGLTVEKKLKGRMVFVLTSKADSTNFKSCFHGTKYRCKKLYFGGYFGALALTQKSERFPGIAVLDLGTGISTLILFRNDRLKSIHVFPIGTGDMVNKISMEFGLDPESAEKILFEHGEAICNENQPSELICFSRPEEKKVEIEKYRVSIIIEEILMDLFDKIKSEMSKAFYSSSKMEHSMICTGGGARIKHIAECLVTHEVVADHGHAEIKFIHVDRGQFKNEYIPAQIWGLMHFFSDRHRLQKRNVSSFKNRLFASVESWFASKDIDVDIS